MMRTIVDKIQGSRFGGPESEYRVYVPNGYGEDETREWPLVVFLHGAGQRGNDSAQLEMHGPTMEAAEGREFPFLLAAPQCPENSVWIMQKERVLAMLETVGRQYRVDRRRVYLTGLSMGGFGTWELAMEHPELFAAILPVCGGGMSWRADRIAHMPIWTFHGDRDDVVPIVCTELMVSALRKLGSQVHYTVLEGTAHDSWTDTYRREDVYGWLLEQRLPG